MPTRYPLALPAQPMCLTPAQAAHIISCSQRTIWLLMQPRHGRKPMLPSYKIGNLKCRRILRHDLLSLFDTKHPTPSKKQIHAEMITYAQAAALLQVSIRTIKGMVARHQLVAYNTRTTTPEKTHRITTPDLVRVRLADVRNLLKPVVHDAGSAKLLPRHHSISTRLKGQYHRAA